LEFELGALHFLDRCFTAWAMSPEPTPLLYFWERVFLCSQAGLKVTILLPQPTECWITGMHHHTQSVYILLWSVTQPGVDWIGNSKFI
jgi:hypothetical protein